MEDKEMTARVSAFSRAYHYEKNETRIFSDSIAKKLITDEGYDATSNYLANGISFFNPNFEGSTEEALRWIVDNMLSPTPLGRAAFAEKKLELAVSRGASQYLVCAAGLDSFAYRKPEWAEALSIFEIDYPTTSEQKLETLKKASVNISPRVYYLKADFAKEQWEDTVINHPNYIKSQTSFVSFLGMVYYLSKAEFESFLKAISNIISTNSSIVFDYPSEQYFEAQQKHAKLAEGSNEDMKACYSYKEMALLLQKNNFEILEHLDQKEITEQYFEAYNQANPTHRMKAQENVSYCLARKL